MNRLVLVALVWVVLIGGVTLFTAGKRPVTNELHPAVPPTGVAAVGVVSLEVSASFVAEPDPFALDAPAGGKALEVLVNGVETPGNGLVDSGGGTMHLERIPGLRPGCNELFVRVHPPTAEWGRAHAVRLVVRRGDVTVLDRTVWSHGAESISTGVPFFLERGAS